MKTLKRRRKENRTNYLKRLKLLKSEKPRLVFRKSNKFLVAQYVESYEAKDKIVFGFNSKELLKYSWPENFSGSLKSIPAAYLLGYLIGKKILETKLEEPIVDFGMNQTLHKTKLFGFLKGLIDSGIKIECKKEAFPEEDRILGKSLKEDFSKYFNQVKTKINSSKDVVSKKKKEDKK